MHPASRLAIAVLVSLASTGGAIAQEAPGLARFSSATPGDALPRGWEVAKITDQKKPTGYKLVQDEGKVVLEAHATGAASGLAQRIPIDTTLFPRVEWRWKISRLIETADNAQASKEDSAVRLVFYFDGDKDKLSFGDRTALSFAETLTGRASPYATLMYIWSNKAPVGSVIQNPRTGRVQMVVASSGSAGVGQWQTLTRNVRDDYKKAFGEDAGKLLAYGVLTDTDNTGEEVTAWYGDIIFKTAQ
jgi:hypothetical protein